MTIFVVIVAWRFGREQSGHADIRNNEPDTTSTVVATPSKSISS